MDRVDELHRVRRVFWTILWITTVAATWLWDQATGAPLVVGRLTPTLNLAAGLVVGIGALLLARMVWRLSGRDARGVAR